MNLTNADSFAEFAADVRCDGWNDILENDPNHALGSVRWSDRVFYLADEGTVKSLNELWGQKFPSVVNRFVSLMQLLKHRGVRYALRAALDDKRQFAF